MNNIIFKSQNIHICVLDTVNIEAISLLESTIFGNKGLKYKHTELNDTISNLINPYFFYLYEENELVGFYCLCRREININEELVNAFYGRYLTIKYSGKGYGKLIKREAIKYIEGICTPLPMFYSYIEENNVYSLGISKKQGFLSHALIKSFVFFRFSPKKDPHVSKLINQEILEIKKLLKQYYQSYSFVLLENIGYNNNYFVYKENEEIVAGLQANPVLWKIIKLDGLLGKLIKVINYIPYLNRIIRTNYSFLAIEGVYLKEGIKEDVLYKLLEHTLVHFNFNTALFQLDQKDSLAKKLILDKNLGLVNKLNDTVTTHLMIKSEQSVITEKPSYISSFDFA
jgi:RimJ/RimL family protein N-acetyltransferase